MRRFSLASDDPLALDGVALASAGEALLRIHPLLEGKLLLATDFDGTISRISLDLWSVAIIPAAQRALRRMAVTPHTQVAFISGRTVADLAPRVRVGSSSYHGDHGAQWARAPRGFRPERLVIEQEPVDPVVAAMAERLKAEVPRLVTAPWLAVEDKGPAVTFHFRRAPDIEAAKAQVRAAVEAVDRQGLLDQPGGRRAWELRPPGASTKGQTLTRLIEQHQPDTVLMLGDDRHDAEAFEVLRAARDAGDIAGLAVAVASPAADTAEMSQRADLVFGHADVTARFLTLLVRERDQRR